MGNEGEWKKVSCWAYPGRPCQRAWRRPILILGKGELESYETGRELNFAWAAEVSHVGCKQGFARGEDRGSGEAEETNALCAEVAVFGSNHVEDVHEEVEVVADAFEGEVFDDAQVEVGEGGLAHAVACGLGAVDDGAIVPVVGVVLGVEADDWCVGLPGAGDEDG